MYWIIRRIIFALLPKTLTKIIFQLLFFFVLILRNCVFLQSLADNTYARLYISRMFVLLQALEE